MKLILDLPEETQNRLDRLIVMSTCEGPVQCIARALYLYEKVWQAHIEGKSVTIEHQPLELR